jgi:hypothetical protein
MRGTVYVRGNQAFTLKGISDKKRAVYVASQTALSAVYLLNFQVQVKP